MRPEDFEIHFLWSEQGKDFGRTSNIQIRKVLRADYQAWKIKNSEFDQLSTTRPPQPGRRWINHQLSKIATERDVEPASLIPADLKVEQNTQAILHFGDFLLSCHENRSILKSQIGLTSFRTFCQSLRVVRLLVEMVIIGGVIYLGWERPFKEWRNEVRAAVTSKQEPASQEIIRATPQPGAWMWDPNHHGTLDRPSPSPPIQP